MISAGYIHRKCQKLKSIVPLTKYKIKLTINNIVAIIIFYQTPPII